MKKFIPLLLTALAFTACEKEPDLSQLDSDYLVYTNYDTQANFKQYSTYYLPDSILIINNSDEATYWKDANAQQILSTYAQNMTAKGYTRVDKVADADLGLQVSYVENTYYFIDYDYPDWWWWYPYYWDIPYWGDWGGWYYPYVIDYSYSTNSYIAEVLDLTAPKGTDQNLPVLWTGFMSGLDYSSATDQALAVSAVNQAFSQSPYLTNK